MLNIWTIGHAWAWPLLFWVPKSSCVPARRCARQSSPGSDCGNDARPTPYESVESMSKHLRFLRTLTFAVALMLVSACGDSPVGPSTSEAPDPLLGGLLQPLAPITDPLLEPLAPVTDPVIGLVDGVVQLLTCSSQPYAITSTEIGRAGGTIVVGSHTLVIPRGALQRPVTITAEQMPGRTNSVRFQPEGLRFEKSAALTMSYSNCVELVAPKQIVYTDEGLSILELLKSRDTNRRQTVTAPVDHFSRYAVAW